VTVELQFLEDDKYIIICATIDFGWVMHPAWKKDAAGVLLCFAVRSRRTPARRKCELFISI